MIENLIHYSLIILIFISVLKDFIFFKIDNEYCILIFLLYLIHLSLLFPSSISFTPLLAAALTLGIGFVLVTLRLIGAGDVKFMAALMVWIPPSEIIDFLFVTTILGSFLSIFEYYFKKSFFRLRNTVILFMKKNIFLKEKTYTTRKGKGSKTPFFKVPVPYGVAIGITAWMYIGF
jgi:prepilin peptidase CpaA